MTGEVHQEPQMADVPSQLLPKEWVPSNQSLLREYEVRIQFLSRGCVVYVGCKSIPFESVELAMKHLNRYVTNPHASRKEWDSFLD